MINAAITPGTQQISDSSVTINIDPQPLSITDRGGNITARKALNNDIMVVCLLIQLPNGLLKFHHFD